MSFCTVTGESTPLHILEIAQAVNEALRAASEAANARMNAVMGGMKIPGLM